jgi:hypothetical protein
MLLEVADAAPVKSPSKPMTYVFWVPARPADEELADELPDESDDPLQAAAAATSEAAVSSALQRNTRERPGTTV